MTRGGNNVAISNRDRVGRGLETPRAGLAPFVERELKARLRGNWRTEVERGSRYEIRRDAEGGIARDNSALFGAMLGQWEEVFRYTLAPPRRALVHEIRRTSATTGRTTVPSLPTRPTGRWTR